MAENKTKPTSASVDDFIAKIQNSRRRTNGGAVVYSDTHTADSNGRFNFDLWDVFDLKRGQVVTISDGINIKTHTVTNLYVDGIDLAADTVFGRADSGTTVEVWMHGDGNANVTVDGLGNWTADFSRA